MVIQLCAGIIYGWSVFRGPVAAHLNWDPGAAALTASVMLSMFVLGVILGGYAQDKLGPKAVTVAGSVLIGVGMAGTALVPASAPSLVYLSYGTIAGLGVGTVYTCTIAAIQKWFPDRRGFASGMIVSAFGLSLLLFAPLARFLLAEVGVQLTFLCFGAGFLLICGACALLIENPPQGYLPKGYVPSQAAVARRQYAPKEILKTKQYYLLAGALLFTLPAYFVLNPVFLSLGTERGLSENLALAGVAITGLSSAAGRLIVAWTSDKIGRKAAMVSIAVMMLAASLTMIAAQGTMFLLCITLISFGFGGAASVYSAMTAESFGTQYGGMNFGLVLLGFGVSALLFPVIAQKLSATGSDTLSFLVAAATCVLAIVLVALMKNPNKEEQRVQGDK